MNAETARDAIVHLHTHRRKDDPISSDEKDSAEPQRRERRDDEERHDNDNHEQNSKQSSEADQQTEGMSPHKKRLFIIGAIIAVLVVGLASLLYYFHARQYQNTDDAYIDGHVSQISPQVTGRIQALYIDDNQEVKAGQLLAEIDSRDYRARLDQSEARLEQANAQVALQQANVGQAEANLHVAEAEAQQAQRDYARYRAINPQAISRQQLDNASANAKSANAKVEAARQAWQAAWAQVGASKAAVQQATSDAQNTALQLSYTKIIAPIDGRVTRRTVELGNVVSPGQPLLSIVSDELWVTANFKETQLTHMQPGQKVIIKVDAYPDLTFAGHVDSFQTGTGTAFSSLPAENATGNFVKVVQRVPVKILFDDVEQRDRYRLAPGLSVEPRVTVR